MSNYINVLRRLEQERRTPDAESPPVTLTRSIEAREDVAPVSAAPAPTLLATPEIIPTEPLLGQDPPPHVVIPLPPVTTTPPPSETTPVAHQLDTRRSRAFATEAHPGIATLLDNIRMLSSGRASRMVVFCGASTTEAVTTLASALAAHAERSGMKAFVGTLRRTTGGTVVEPSPGHAADTTALAVDLDEGSSTEELHSWVKRVAPNSELVVITGPPLALSIDAALLACACDGLVIVAESEVTERDALQIAAERAKIAGCRTLGVVMHGTKDRLPGWIRRIMSKRSEQHEQTTNTKGMTTS